MKKAILAFVAVASISVSLHSAKAEAKEIVVKEGESLWKLAQQYNTSVEDIKSTNELTTDVIKPNDKLEIVGQEIYPVKTGDNLWTIAKEFGVSVQDIMDLNEITSTIIHPGDSLLIMPVSHSDQAKATDVVYTPEKKAKAAMTTRNESTSSNVKSLTVSATAYTADCKGCSGITAAGIDLKKNPNAKVIAVDPNIIPMGTKVFVEGYGYAIAADTGGAIKGNKIDVFFSDLAKAKNWGVKKVKIDIIE